MPVRGTEYIRKVREEYYGLKLICEIHQKNIAALQENIAALTDKLAMLQQKLITINPADMEWNGKVGVTSINHPVYKAICGNCRRPNDLGVWPINGLSYICPWCVTVNYVKPLVARQKVYQNEATE